MQRGSGFCLALACLLGVFTAKNAGASSVAPLWSRTWRLTRPFAISSGHEASISVAGVRIRVSGEPADPTSRLLSGLGGEGGRLVGNAHLPAPWQGSKLVTSWSSRDAWCEHSPQKILTGGARILISGGCRDTPTAPEADPTPASEPLEDLCKDFICDTMENCTVPEHIRCDPEANETERFLCLRKQLICLRHLRSGVLPQTGDSPTEHDQILREESDMPIHNAAAALNSPPSLFPASYEFCQPQNCSTVSLNDALARLTSDVAILKGVPVGFEYDIQSTTHLILVIRVDEVIGGPEFGDEGIRQVLVPRPSGQEGCVCPPFSGFGQRHQIILSQSPGPDGQLRLTESDYVHIMA